MCIALEGRITMNGRRAIAAGLTLLSIGPLAAGHITVKVSLHPEVCHEVRFPRLSEPKDLIHGISSGGCAYEIRRAGDSAEQELYFGLLCNPTFQRTYIAEKYAVALGRQFRVRRIPQTAWDSAPSLPRSGLREYARSPNTNLNGIEFKGHLLERSGPVWFGKGVPLTVPAMPSGSGNLAAVNSWDGIYVTYDPLDAELFQFDRVNGRYWIDLFDAIRGVRLLLIQGEFHGIGPDILRDAYWYADRYYLLPIGGAADALSICIASCSVTLRRRCAREIGI